MKMAPESGYPLISYWKNTWKYFVFQSLHANYKPIRIIVSGLIFTKAANIMISLMQCICRCTNADTKICWYILLRKECPYSELFWSVLSPNARNTDQNNSEYGHLLRSVLLHIKIVCRRFSIITPFTIWDMRNRDMRNACLQIYRKNSVHQKVAHFIKKCKL